MEFPMLMNLVGDWAAAVLAETTAGTLAAAGSTLASAGTTLTDGAVSYLSASLLAPLSWMFVVEVCRRTQGPAPSQHARAHRTAASRLAIAISNLAKRNSRGRWFDDLEES
jgi:hypothetical protein